MLATREAWAVYMFRSRSNMAKEILHREQLDLALLKAQVSLQLGNVFSSDNRVSVSIMYSYMY